MDSLLEDVKDYLKWLFFGTRRPDQPVVLDRREAKKDLFWRMFIIANAPFFIAYHGTYWLSMSIATSMQKYIYSSLPARFKKLDGLLTTALYGILQIALLGTSIVYIVFPAYKFAFFSFLHLIK